MSAPRIVFIAGLHRSGTTLLARSLGRHPDVSDFTGTGVREDEGQFLQTVYPIARIYGGPGRFAFDERAHVTESSPLVNEQNRAKLFEEWSGYWDLSKTVLLEKSPPNLLKTRFLQAMFPDARFIVMLRHPVAVSLATKKWARTSERSLVRHWLAAHRVFEADLPALPNVTLVTYEAFVQDPDATLARLFAFMDLPAAAVPRPDVRDANRAYLERWRNDGWRAWSRRRIRRDLEAETRHFGYSLVDPTLSPRRGDGSAFSALLP